MCCLFIYVYFYFIRPIKICTPSYIGLYVYYNTVNKQQQNKNGEDIVEENKQEEGSEYPPSRIMIIIDKIV